MQLKFTVNLFFSPETINSDLESFEEICYFKSFEAVVSYSTSMIGITLDAMHFIKHLILSIKLSET